MMASRRIRSLVQKTRQYVRGIHAGKPLRKNVRIHRAMRGDIARAFRRTRRPFGHEVHTGVVLGQIHRMNKMAAMQPRARRGMLSREEAAKKQKLQRRAQGNPWTKPL